MEKKMFQTTNQLLLSPQVAEIEAVDCASFVGQPISASDVIYKFLPHWQLKLCKEMRLPIPSNSSDR
jgi:hypothetical protein